MTEIDAIDLLRKRCAAPRALASADAAAALVEADDLLCLSVMDGIPVEFLDALLRREDRPAPLTLYMGAMPKMPQARPGGTHLRICDYFYAHTERAMENAGFEISYAPVHLSDTDCGARGGQRLLAVLQATPPNAEGMVSLGPVPFEPALLQRADLVVGQLNRNLPWIFGEGRVIPLESLSHYYFLDEPLPPTPPFTLTPEEVALSAYIAERIPDGACLQLGIGGIGIEVGRQLRHKRDLGIHSEMFVDSMVDLIECGAVNNAKKSYLPGLSVFGAVLVGSKAYAFLHENRLAAGNAFSVVNDPRVISRNDRVVSVNGALEVDLFGQVCAESIGYKQYSGTGGQADFVRGARWSKDGMSFIALPSTRLDASGVRQSKLTCALRPGSAVTTPRADVQYIVTEYGLADLRGKSLDARARALIAIAHPDFRDELLFQAKKLGIVI